MIETETKEKTEIHTLLRVGKFKSEIHLQDVRSEKCEIRLNNVDANMVAFLIHNWIMGETARKKKKKWIKIFPGKEEWYLNNASSGFHNAAQSLRQEK